jgi:phage tail sheath protein FI
VRPGVEVASLDSGLPASTTPTAIDTAFVVTLAERGSHLTPQLITSFSAFTAATGFGAAVSNGWGYHVLERAFNRGLARAYVIRAVGPTPVYATINLAGASGTAAVVTAKSVGAWANGATGGLTVEVLSTAADGSAGSTHRSLVIRQGGVVVETTPRYLAATAAADLATWSLTSAYVTVTVGGGTQPLTAAGAANLASGTDDAGAITDTQWAAALAKFDVGLGPGQVAMPGRTTTQAHVDLLAHANTTDRVAILDAPDTSVKATLQASAVALASSPGYRRGGLFAPWVKVAGSSSTTTRLLPPSADVLGLVAAVDRTAGPGQPAAGDFGRLVDVLELTATFTDQDAQDLGAPDASGLTNPPVNLLRSIDGTLQVYGWRTLAKKDTDPNWWALSWPRIDMAIKAEGRLIANRYAFRQIDGRDQTVNAFAGELEAMLDRYYQAGSLYGSPDDDRPGTAYRVDVGAQVNTPATKAAGDLRAAIYVRMSPFGELVRITVTKLLPTQSVS